MVDFRIIAHRCRGFGEDENTLVALKKALASGIDEVEMDLQLTQDKRLVVWHDNHIHTLEGKKLKINKLFLKEAETRGLMSLDTLLKTFKKYGKGKRLNIDIKKYGGEKELVANIRKYKLQKRVIIVSWISKSLERVNRMAHTFALSYSFTPKVQSTAQGGKPFLPAFFLPSVVKKLPLETVNLVPHLLPVSKSIVERLNKLGIDVIVVNEDSVKGCKKLREMGVKGVMTNKAEELLQHYR